MSLIDQESVLNFMREDLRGFSAAMFPEYRPSQHHKLLADRLQSVESGRTKRLVVLMPPRHGKSKTASELFPAWFLGRDPKRRIMALSYGQELSDTFGRSVRNYLKTPTFQALFPKCQLSSDSNSVRRFSTTTGGSYTGVGLGGPVTGKGADLILLDDVIKNREEADSQTYRESLINFYKSVARTRLQPGGAIVLVQTRWGTTDFITWLLSETSHEGWEVISLPAIALKNDPLSRLPGEPLWPESYPLEALEQLRETLGSRDWSSLYQQCPLADSDVIFQQKWLQFYDQAPDIGNFIDRNYHRHTNNPIEPANYIVHSWDLSFGGTSAGSSWVCGQAWGIKGKHKYLLHMYREQAGFSESLEAIRAMDAQFPASHILVEAAANGRAVLDVMRIEFGDRLIGIKVTDSKQSRAFATVPMLERSEVSLPSPKLFQWVKPLLVEMQSFPQSATDDAIDSMTQCLNWVDKRIRAQERDQPLPSISATVHWDGSITWNNPTPREPKNPYQSWRGNIGPRPN